MSDYTELCARLRALLAGKKPHPGSGATPQTMGCESYRLVATGNAFAAIEEAADALESQAREITELRTWRDEAVRLCAKRNCAGRDRRIRDLEEDNDALRARAEAAEKAIRDHNDGCVAACEARQRGDYGQDCSAWISRKKRCLDCARDSMIDYGSEMFHVKHSQTNQEGL